MVKMTPANRSEIQIIKNHFPNIQAIYLFGSYGTEEQRPESDVDIALLLSHGQATERPVLYGTALHLELERHFHSKVDLINLRMENVVFQNEILSKNRKIFCQDALAADKFELLTLSLYQKLNEERAGIIEDAIKTGRFYNL